MAQVTKCPKCGKSRFRMQREKQTDMSKMTMMDEHQGFAEDGHPGYSKDMMHFQCLECGTHWSEEN